MGRFSSSELWDRTRSIILVQLELSPVTPAPGWGRAGAAEDYSSAFNLSSDKQTVASALLAAHLHVKWCITTNGERMFWGVTYSRFER